MLKLNGKVALRFIRLAHNGKPIQMINHDSGPLIVNRSNAEPNFKSKSEQ